MSMRRAALAELTNLRWMTLANRDGEGLFGPSVRRYGPLPEMQPLIDAGLCLLTVSRLGYWITPAGRDAIAGEDWT